MRTDRKCGFCGKVYYKRDHFERHVRTHTGERPFACTACVMTFSRQDTLRRHVRVCNASTAGSTGQTVRGDSSPSLLDRSGAETELSPMTANVNSLNLSDSFLLPANSDSHLTSWNWNDLDLDACLNMGFFDPTSASPTIPWSPPQPQGASSSALPAEDAYLDNGRLIRQTRPNLDPPIADDEVTSLRRQAESGLSRQTLATSLKRPLPDVALPPTKALNQYIQIFTTRLWAVLPILHLPTFQPGTTHPLLVLSMCSLGALAHGSEAALHIAERLFHGVRKAILVSYAPEQDAELHTLAMLQASVIGQTFAILCGKPPDLLTAQSFHSTLCVLTVRLADHLTSRIGNLEPGQCVNDGEFGEVQWRDWVSVQTIHRILNVLYIHNGELAVMKQQPSSLRTGLDRVPRTASDNVYLARSHGECARMMVASGQTPSTLSAYAALSCLGARIGHLRHAIADGLVDNNNMNGCQISLLSWMEEHARVLDRNQAEKLSLLMLWHACFVHFICDLDALTRTVCGNADESNGKATRALDEWLSSGKATRCAIHAILICKMLERFKIGDIPAIHVSRVAADAGTVLALYAAAISSRTPEPCLGDVLENQAELQLILKTNLYTAQEWADIPRGLKPELCKTFALSVCTLLRRLGPWPLAVRFASTLDGILTCV